MVIGVPRETLPGEHRVALTPSVVPLLTKANAEVLVEAGAGEDATFADHRYTEQGATIAASRDELFAKADVLAQVWTFCANPEAGRSDVTRMRPGHVILGFCHPLSGCQQARTLAERGVSLLAMELMPRITRAQSMDALSSMSSIAGYKAVLLAANASPRMFPMLMTAAGRISAARVFVVGAGVAGLQAIASARRLGAIVEAYDVRPAVKEQVESLGARFVDLDLEAGDAEDARGYARERGEEFYRRQREMMLATMSGNDVVITTAAVPGKKAPILITEPMVEAMAPGSVIVDLAAERGGNCEVTRPGETVVHQGVTVLGPMNVPSSVPLHASQLYARNLFTFLDHLLQDGELVLDRSDEITAATLVTHQGDVVHPWVRELLGLPSRERSDA